MAKSENKLTTKDLQRVYFRNLFGLQWGWNYEKMQGLGYCWVVMPALKKIYKDDPEGLKKAMKMQLGYFNTTPAMSHLIVGADIALEEEFKNEAESAVVGLKTGLMGPFAGVGDTLFIAIYRAIFFSIASYMALDGNIFGLFIPVIACMVVLSIRWQFTKLGYKEGKKLVTGFAEKIAPITEGAAVLGLTVVGGLIASVINFDLDLTFTMGEVVLSVQENLDQIMPKMIPLIIVMFAYKLLGKKNMNSTKLTFVLLGMGMVLGNLQNIFNWIVALF